MVIWAVLAGSGKTADLVLACFGWFSSHMVNHGLQKSTLIEYIPSTRKP